jgi:predicted alpha/beta superfamily hydrolase
MMIIKWDVTIPELSGDMPRKGYVYLPDSYEASPDRRYPVLYMFDGHNVFFDEDATYGKSWGMKDYMDRSGKDLIIVGIACNEQGSRRLNEYSPITFDYEPVGHIEGLGKVYMDWMLRELKPYIDREYRTLPDRANTFIAGSSMGGLMSLFAICCYNSVFSKAACLSSSLWIKQEEGLRLLGSGNMDPDTWIYMDYGSEELPNHPGCEEAQIAVFRMLLSKGAKPTLRIVPGGSHCEASWEKQIPVFMECLGL